jgi:hypothetical protein
MLLAPEAARLAQASREALRAGAWSFLRLQPDLDKPARQLDARLSRTRVELAKAAKESSTARLFLRLLNRACSTNKKTARRRSFNNVHDGNGIKTQPALRVISGSGMVGSGTVLPISCAISIQQAMAS